MTALDRTGRGMSMAGLIVGWPVAVLLVLAVMAGAGSV